MSNREERLQIVYRMMKKAAEMGDIAPSNSVLCVSTGMSSSGSPSLYVKELARRGLIEVELVGRAGRIVTIVETGESTARPSTDAHYAKLAKMKAETARKRRRQFADLVAEHGTITAASRAFGISQQRGSQMWQRILEDMGE